MRVLKLLILLLIPAFASGQYVYVNFQFNRMVRFYEGSMFLEMAAPSTPPANFGHVYVKTDGRMYFKNDAGTEYLLTPGAGAGTVSSIATTSPITGGTITTTGTIGINDAAADGTTKGAASFTAADFNSSSGNISLDYTNGQMASASVAGYVSTGAQDIAGVKTFQTDISFEGATADANETILTATDPTADATITVQNTTGTMPLTVGTPVHLTAQTSSIAATTCYTTPADGFYQVCVTGAVTQAATTSSSIATQVRWTNQADNVVKTTTAVNNVHGTAGNTTGSGFGYVVTVYAKTGTAIQYITTYASSGATSMQYSLDITVVKL